MTAPAYTATIDALDYHGVAKRGITEVRPRALDGLNGLNVPIALAADSRFTEVEQVQLAIQAAAAAFLPKLALSAVLWQDREDGTVGGDLSVWHQRAFHPIATVTVVPAQSVERAA